MTCSITPPTDLSHKSEGAVAVQPEQLFRALFEQATVGVALIETATGRFFRVNQRYGEIVGLSRDEMTATTFMAITHPDDLQAALTNMEELQAGRIREFSMEKRHVRSDGSVVWVDVTVSPLWDAAEQPSVHLAVVQDITARKQAEQKLAMLEQQVAQRTSEVEESRQLLQAIIEGTSDAVFVKDVQGRYLLLNEAGSRFVGKRPLEVLGKDDTCLFPPADAQAVMRLDRQTMLGRKTVTLEETLTMPDGDERTFQTAKGPVFNAEGQMAGVFGISRDITERKQAEEELRRSEHRHRTLVEVLSVVTWSCPPSGFHVEPQPSWMAFTGQTAEEMLGAGWTNVVHPDDLAGAAQRWRDAVTEGRPFFNEHRIRRHDGEWRWMRVHAVPIRDVDGRVLEWFGMNLDITERKQAEEVLHESELRFRTLVERIGDVFWISDPAQKRLIYASRAFEEIWGRDLRQLYNHFEVWLNAIHEDDRERVKREFFTNISVGQYDSEYRVVRPDGTIRWIRDHGKPLGIGNLVAGVAEDITQRKEAEGALRESETRFRSFFENAAVGAAQINAAWRFVDVNDRFCQITGYSRDDLIGKMGPLDLDHPDEVEIDRRRVTDLFRIGTPYLNYEKRYVRKDGNVVWVRVTVASVRDAQGIVQTTAALVEDITERKQAEQRLRESEERLRAFINATNDVVYCMSPDWTELRHLRGREFISDTLEPSGVWLDRYIHPDDQPQVTATIQRAIQSKSVFELEHRVIRVDGSLGWTHSRAIPILDDRGEIIEWFGAAQDVTPRKQVEEALRQLNETLELSVVERTEALRRSEMQCSRLVEHFPGPISRIDRDLKYIYASPGYERWFGKDPNTIVGLSVRDVIGEEAFQQARPSITKALGGERVTFELSLPTTPRGVRHGLVTLEPEYDHSGACTGFYVFVTDITERVRMEHALQDSYDRLQTLTRQLQVAEERERSRLSRELHDEFGQVLSGLKLELAKSTAVLKGGSSPAAIRVRTKRMIRMVDRLFSSLREMVSALRPAVLEELGLVPALEALADDMEERSGLRCRIMADRTDSRGRCGPEIESAVYRIAQELLTNVVRHAKATTATLTFEQGEDHVVLAVQDDGRGFDVRRVRNKKRFGLRGVRERVELLGGTVTIESTRKLGTTVAVRLPIARHGFSHPTMAHAPPLKSGATEKRPRRGN